MSFQATLNFVLTLITDRSVAHNIKNEAVVSVTVTTTANDVAPFDQKRYCF
jgi:hypothetical protein